MDVILSSSHNVGGKRKVSISPTLEYKITAPIDAESRIVVTIRDGQTKGSLLIGINTVR